MKVFISFDSKFAKMQAILKHSKTQLCNYEAPTKTKSWTESHRQWIDRKDRKSSGNESRLKVNKNLPTNEGYRIFQAMLLVISVLTLSYHGFRYGRTEYSLLENGKAVNGFLSSHKKVVTICLGYSIPYSILSSVAALMLIYSLISKKPHWSLPSIIFTMADLVCDMGDALVASWLFFGYLQTTTAIFYTVCTASVILGELWAWFGVLRLYEYRTFQSKLKNLKE